VKLRSNAISELLRIQLKFITDEEYSPSQEEKLFINGIGLTLDDVRSSGLKPVPVV
jgi:hypothetical protein